MKTIFATLILSAAVSAHAYQAPKAPKAPQPPKKMEFYQGQIEQLVEVEYDSPDLKKRSYETKCRASVGVRMTEKTLEIVNGHYSCQDGFYSDPTLRLVIKEGMLFIPGRRGQLPKDAQSVGQVTKDGFELALARTRKVETRERKMDEKGCPTHKVDRVKNELTDTIAYRYTKTEKGYNLERMSTVQSLVQVPKRYEHCRIKFARHAVESQTTRNTSGVLVKR